MRSEFWLLFALGAFAFGYLWGRYLRLTRKNSALTEVVPVRTVRPTDFKSNEIYKAMASSLKRKGQILIKSEDPEKTKKKLAEILKQEPQEFETVPQTTKDTFLIKKLS